MRYRASAVCLAVFTLAGCRALPPEERIAALAADYSQYPIEKVSRVSFATIVVITNDGDDPAFGEGHRIYLVYRGGSWNVDHVVPYKR